MMDSGDLTKMRSGRKLPLPAGSCFWNWIGDLIPGDEWSMQVKDERAAVIYLLDKTKAQ